MLGALREALTRPAAFFEAEAEDPGLLQPAIVVGVVAIFGAIASFPTLQTTLGTVPEGAQVFVLVALVFGLLIGLVTPYVIWLVYALLFYGISALFDGEGEFRDLFAMTGWGFAPRIIASLASAAATFILLPSGGFQSPEAAAQFAQELATSPIGIASEVVGLLMTLWAAWVWTYAVAEARNLSVRDAAITVGIVVAAAVILSLGSTYLL